MTVSLRLPVVLGVCAAYVTNDDLPITVNTVGEGYMLWLGD